MKFSKVLKPIQVFFIRPTLNFPAKYCNLKWWIKVDNKKFWIDEQITEFMNDPPTNIVLLLELWLKIDFVVEKIFIKI
jgi:hypothetical protein